VRLVVLVSCRRCGIIEESELTVSNVNDFEFCFLAAFQDSLDPLRNCSRLPTRPRGADDDDQLPILSELAQIVWVHNSLSTPSSAPRQTERPEESSQRGLDQVTTSKPTGCFGDSLPVSQISILVLKFLDGRPCRYGF
jgi:hypothetical protein